MPPYVRAADNSIEIDGTRDGEQAQARVILVDQRYFAALRIPLLQGRVWNTDENNRGDFIAVVNQAFATRYLSSSNALGRQLRIPGLIPRNRYQTASAQSTAWRQIIGVVGDSRNDGLDRPVDPAIYLPYTTVMLALRAVLRPHPARSARLSALHPRRCRIRRFRPDALQQQFQRHPYPE